MEFDFTGINEEKKGAITTTEGPLLIIAGPGTGKTMTLVQRTLYLITQKHVKPENILLATFTEKAAKELVTRITNAVDEVNQKREEAQEPAIAVNLNDMYIGTFHSICLRILQDHLEFTRLKKNYRLLDGFDQQYVVYRNISAFRAVPGFDAPDLKLQTHKYSTAWAQAGKICGYVNNLTEEMVDVDAMEKDRNPAMAAMARIKKLYDKLMKEGLEGGKRGGNLLDFSTIQTECYRLLKGHPDILEELRQQIQYLMIDEYQDTNYIQEQLVFLLAGDRQNICVVGDDDQGLYRFRGATIRNILEFPQKFPKGKCHIVHLETNYRSEPEIIDFYNKWMTTPLDFSWSSPDGKRKFRYPKAIKPAPGRKPVDSPAVVQLVPQNGESWEERVFQFIHGLKDSGEIDDYNQIALLAYSVSYEDPKNERESLPRLADYLESHGIPVYSPRSDKFFDRKEIKQAVGCLIRMFPAYEGGLKELLNKHASGSFKYLHGIEEYYKNCLAEAEKLEQSPGGTPLHQYMNGRRIAHASLAGTDHNTDYGYTALLYQLFRFEPFHSILDNNLKNGVADTRAIRNLAILTQVIGKFEYLNSINVLSGKWINQNTESLFNNYLRLQVREGVREFEDESEYAPSGCVSFLTIHQAKGMEFPIVIVVTPDAQVRHQNKKYIEETIQQKYYNGSRREFYEPYRNIRQFDYWRRFYTAFSRAESLLVLTANHEPEKKGPFTRVYPQLPDDSALHLSAFHFHDVKPVNLKQSFSFTSDISVYETCPKQYKFYKELGFQGVRQGSMLFGLVVHETIEDIHRAAIRGEENTISANIDGWFEANYDTLVHSTHSYLAPLEKDVALAQVKAYADKQKGRWDLIRQAEVDVSLVKNAYILEGRIDLIRGKGDTVELVDFKGEKKPAIPDLNDLPARVAHYKHQLEVYAHLVENRYGLHVSGMNLYYTGERVDPIVHFDYVKSDVDRTIAGFDGTVKKILAKDFDHEARLKKTCENCDFRFFCGKAETKFSSAAPAAPRRRRGRPRKNAASTGQPEQAAPEAPKPKKRRGRPPKKAASTPAEPPKPVASIARVKRGKEKTGWGRWR